MSGIILLTLNNQTQNFKFKTNMFWEAAQLKIVLKFVDW
jgi:hypothetical protein